MQGAQYEPYVYFVHFLQHVQGAQNIIEYLHSASCTWRSVSLYSILFGDNAAALKFGEEQGVNSLTKHIDLRNHFLHTLVEYGVITMNYVCTNDNIADIFTKPLSVEKFQYFAKFLFATSRSILFRMHTKLTHLNKHRHLDL